MTLGLLGDAGSCLELLGEAGSCLELLGDAGSCLELLGEAGSCLELQYVVHGQHQSHGQQHTANTST